MRAVILGTDCFGIDAPLFALEQLASGIGSRIEYAFASDVNPTTRKALQAATPPPWAGFCRPIVGLSTGSWLGGHLLVRTNGWAENLLVGTNGCGRTLIGGN